MRTLAAILLLFVAAADRAHANEDDAYVTAALRVNPERVVPGEAFEVLLEIAYDHVQFEQHAAQLFRHALDVPLQVTLPWLDKPDGARALPPQGPQEDEAFPRRTLVLNGRVVQAREFEVGHGPDHAVTRMGLSVRFLAQQPGTIEIPAPKLRYAFADAFEEGLLGERVAIAPRFFEREGEALSVIVRPYPEPIAQGFTGAVGHTDIEASLDKDRGQVGEPLRLTLRRSGADNLALFEAPTLEGFEGFDVRGKDDDRGSPVRTVVYEIVPQSARVRQVPPIRFAYLLPRLPHDGQYVVIHTGPLFLTVTPAPGTQPPTAPEGEDAHWPGWPYALAAAFVLLALFAAGRRRRPPPAPQPHGARDEARIEAATNALAASANDRTLAAYLAAHLRCSASAVIGPDLALRLQGAGVAPEVAERAARMLEALVAARYGGASASIDPALLRALQEALTT